MKYLSLEKQTYFVSRLVLPPQQGKIRFLVIHKSVAILFLSMQ